MNRFLLTLIAALAVSTSIFAQPPQKNSPAPDKAYLQQIWDGWSTLNPENVAKFYDSGPHTFFDIAPLKYDSWQQYDSGVKTELGNYKSAKFTVNDDAAIHPHSNLVWATATVKFEMDQKSGKVETGDMRWTAIFENKGGTWKIIHEHVSVPMQ